MGACVTVQGMKDPVVGDTQAPIMKWAPEGGFSDRQFVLKEKFWSWSGEDFKAKSRSGKTVCRFKGDALAFNSTIRVKDLSGREIYLLDQKTVVFGKKFEIKQNGKIIAELTRDTHFGGEQRWELKVNGRIYWRISGTHFGHKFVIRNAKGAIVGKSARDLWQMESYNSYGVEAGEGTDCLMLLSCLAMIDTACDQDK